MKKKLWKILTSEIVVPQSSESSGRAELIGSIFFMLISLLLTAVNLIKHVDTVMTVATSVLTLGFAAASILAYFRKLNASRILAVVLCAVTFSLFALIGGNDGFAILWILLVPVIASLWVGLRLGLLVSGYFQIFLVILFYTPFSEYVKDYYSPTFMLRFPMLYLASFGAITFLMWQRENLLKGLDRASHYDALTGLRNRRSCTEMSARIKKEGMHPGMTIFSLDLNRLKFANDNFGHEAGDELLKAAAGIIEKSFIGCDCFRVGGDEFVVLTESCDPAECICRMKEACAGWRGKYMESISISVGYGSLADHPGMSFEELSTLADQGMYQDKARFYTESGFERRK